VTIGDSFSTILAPPLRNRKFVDSLPEGLDSNFRFLDFGQAFCTAPELGIAKGPGKSLRARWLAIAGA